MGVNVIVLKKDELKRERLNYLNFPLYIRKLFKHPKIRMELSISNYAVL